MVKNDFSPRINFEDPQSDIQVGKRKGEERFVAGVFAPGGIPDPDLRKLEKAIYEATKAPQFHALMEKMSMTPQWRNSQEYSGC